MDQNQYDVVNNPYDQGGQYPPQNQGQYPPQNQGQYPPQPAQGQYPPQGQPPQGQYPPQGQGQGQGQYPPQGQPQGQPAGAPPVPTPPPPQNGGGGHDRKQLIKLRTQTGNALDPLNLVMMTGYFHHMRDQQGQPKFTQTGNSVRLGFWIGEEQTWTDQNGQAQSKTVWHRFQAWNDFAKTLVQVHDGTPIKVWGNLTRFYMRDENNNITGELVDVKVNKFEFP